MENNNTELQVNVTPEEKQVSIYTNVKTYEDAMRMAMQISQSDMIPEKYKGKPGNVMIAIDLARRVGVSPQQVMQNLDIIQGKPSWSSAFVSGVINSCGRFSNLRYKFEGIENTDEWSCVAYATNLQTGDELASPKISIKIAKAEGWFDRKGSKWRTMPKLMMMYRTAALFGRLYASDILQGMQTIDEVQDVNYVEVNNAQFNNSTIDDINNEIQQTSEPKANDTILNKTNTVGEAEGSILNNDANSTSDDEDLPM